jgi:hypothetical protein
MTTLPDFIEQQTHGQPPHRDCLKGSDEKWEGYLLGVEEAKHAAQGWIASRTLNSERRELCPECNGSETPTPCWKCHGTRFVQDDERHEYLMVFRERDAYRKALQSISNRNWGITIWDAVRIASEALAPVLTHDADTQWRCGDCQCLNALHESFCYRCGAGQPE